MTVRKAASARKDRSMFLLIMRSWRMGLADGLRNEDPLLVLSILDLIDVNDDATQNDLAASLSVSQSQVSKLIRKLINEGYVDESTPHHDGRLRLLRTTSSGRGLLYHLESELPDALQAAIRRIRLVENAAPESRFEWNV